jgi:O-antigen/teichoic acid export membrane protein
MRKQTLISIKYTLIGIAVFVILALIGTYMGWFDEAICGICTAMAVMIVMVFISTNEAYKSAKENKPKEDESSNKQ